MINFNNVVDGLFVGGCPKSGSDIEALKQVGISAVLNLQTDADFVAQKIDWPLLELEYKHSGIPITRIQIVDFDETDFIRLVPAAVNVISRFVDEGHTVYVHCTAGSERSPSVVTSYLAWYRDMSMADALALMRSRRKCNPYEAALHEADLEFRKTDPVDGTTPTY